MCKPKAATGKWCPQMLGDARVLHCTYSYWETCWNASVLGIRGCNCVLHERLIPCFGENMSALLTIPLLIMSKSYCQPKVYYWIWTLYELCWLSEANIIWSLPLLWLTRTPQNYSLLENDKLIFIFLNYYIFDLFLIYTIFYSQPWSVDYEYVTICDTSKRWCLALGLKKTSIMLVE